MYLSVKKVKRILCGDFSKHFWILKYIMLVDVGVSCLQAHTLERTVFHTEPA